jgi:phage recombination protein Bet
MSTELITRYDTAFGPVELSPDTVKRYLAKGQNFTDQELSLFISLCKFQKLNPFVNEAYLIKYGTECQMVVGYGTYVRRAEEHPEYIRRESGITVQRGNDIIQKPGQCLYPGEKLIGGWCTVYKCRNGFETQCDMIEVQLEEYIQYKNQDGKRVPNTNWANKPATMIHKVAVSQALRAAFPTEFAGLYVAEELAPVIEIDPAPEKDDPAITQEQRQALFNAAKSKYGAKWKDEFKVICTTETGLTSTTGMKLSQYTEVMKKILEAAAPADDLIQPVPESSDQTHSNDWSGMPAPESMFTGADGSPAVSK